MDIPDDSQSPWGDEPGSGTPTSTTSAGKNETTNSPSASANITTASIRASTAPVKTPGGRGSRARKYASQPSRLEVVDDSSDPLGPLGGRAFEEPDEPPALPQKETPAPRSPRPSTATSQASTRRKRDDDTTSVASGTTAASATAGAGPTDVSQQRQGTASVSIEQAAKPSFTITVGDPHKVGDLTSSHIEYQIRTKTTSKAFRQPEFEVSRRYNNFTWLYNQLHSNNPGVIVPPPPEKQAMGRFESDFVEARRSALEKMLNKTAAHPILHHDSDFKLFLESDSFSVDVKHRERKDPDMPSESKGMFSGLNLSVGSGSKFIEHDDWFLDRRMYLDTQESQLRALARALESTIAQRRALSDACNDFSASLSTLSSVELSPAVTTPLALLSDVQLRIRDLYARQAAQDVLTLGNVLDEYVRLIGSIKKAFDMRQRSWLLYHNADSDLSKRRGALDKIMRQGRSQQDRLAQLQADVADAERRVHQARLSFDDLGKSMRAELERFEAEKVEDFRAGVETYLEGAVEAQKELIETWETFLMHLDAEESEGALDFSRPVLTGDAAAAAFTGGSQGQGGQRQQQQEEESDDGEAPVGRREEDD